MRDRAFHQGISAPAAAIVIVSVGVLASFLVAFVPVLRNGIWQEHWRSVPIAEQADLGVGSSIKANHIANVVVEPGIDFGTCRPRVFGPVNPALDFGIVGKRFLTVQPDSVVDLT